MLRPLPGDHGGLEAALGEEEVAQGLADDAVHLLRNVILVLV